MPEYHLDANVGVDFLRGRSAVLRQRFIDVPTGKIALCEIVAAELLVGALKSANIQAISDTSAFVARYRRVVIDAAITTRYADLRVALESQGQRMDDHDLWIAATALAMGAILVTSDRAFARIPNLTVEDWRV